MANRWSSKYSRERKRVTSILRELRKAGYRFNDNIIPKALPRTGRTEQSLKQATLELRKFTRSKFYRESTGRITEQGEVLPVKRTATERRRQTREIQRKGDKPLSEKYTVYDNVGKMFNNLLDDPQAYEKYMYSVINDTESKLQNVNPSDYHSSYQYQYHLRYATRAYQILQDIIMDEGGGDEEIGKTIVAQRLQEHSTEIGELINTILYESGKQKGDTDVLNQAITRFATIIRGESLSDHENEELTYLAEIGMGVNTI